MSVCTLGVTPMAERRDLYQEVTDKVLAIIGKLSEHDQWRRPWSHQMAATGSPQNIGGHEYRGVNILLLTAASMEMGFTDPRWMTFNKAREYGHVRRGAKGQQIYFWSMIDTPDKAGLKATLAGAEVGPTQIPFLRVSTVFNAQDVDGVEPLVKSERTWQPLAAVQDVALRLRIQVRNGGAQAYFAPSSDHIQMPDAFPTPESHAAVFFHEAAHWAGGGRADRRLGREFGLPGSPQRAMEELIAEWSSAMLLNHYEIGGDAFNDEGSQARQLMDNNARYLKSWAEVLKSDKHAVFKAAKQAQRVTDYVTGKLVLDAAAQPMDHKQPEPVSLAVQAVLKLAKSPAKSIARRNGFVPAGAFFQAADTSGHALQNQ